MCEQGKGCPTEGQCEKERQVYAFLDRLALCYKTVHYPPAATMEDCRAVDEMLGARMCKNLFLKTRNGSAFYLLLMPAEKPFKTKQLSAQIGSSRLSFANEEELMQYLSCAPGSAGVLSLLFDKEDRVKLLIDRDLLEAEYIGCHPGINTASVSLVVCDLIEKILPTLGKEPTYVTLTAE